MSIELIYLGFAILSVITVFSLVILFINLAKKDKAYNDNPKRVKYNFYLLREQYKALLNAATFEIGKSKEAGSFKSKMKHIETAHKKILSGLNFFPANGEGEKLLYDIAQIKREIIEQKCHHIRAEIEARSKNYSLKKLHNFILKELAEIKKMQASHPHNYWKDFYNETYLRYISAKFFYQIKLGNSSLLKHHYRIARKNYLSGIQILSKLPLNQRKSLDKYEYKVKRIVEKINLKSGTTQIKKAA